MNQAIWAVAGSILTAVIMTAFSTFVKTEKYGDDIKRIKEDVSEISDSIKAIDKRLFNTNLFVGSAHPNKNTALLSFAGKIDKMSYEDFGILVSAAKEIEFTPEVGPISSARVREILANYDVTQDDLQKMKESMDNSNLNWEITLSTDIGPVPQ